MIFAFRDKIIVSAGRPMLQRYSICDMSEFCFSLSELFQFRPVLNQMLLKSLCSGYYLVLALLGLEYVNVSFFSDNVALPR